MSKELIFQALRHEKTDKIPWVPFAGVHAGKLKGYTAKDLLTDENKLYDSLMEVYKLYMPDGMPIMFDLQIEAEILGCDLLCAEYNPPSVVSHPCEDCHIPSDDMIPKATDGRLPMVLNTMKRIKESIDDTALYGLLCGPLTLASHLRGSDFFMDMFNNKQFVEDLMTFCTKVAIQIADYYIDAGMDVIAVVDPLVSQVSPKFFAKLMGTHFQKVFDHIR